MLFRNLWVASRTLCPHFLQSMVITHTKFGLNTANCCRAIASHSFWRALRLIHLCVIEGYSMVCLINLNSITFCQHRLKKISANFGENQTNRLEQVHLNLYFTFNLLNVFIVWTNKGLNWCQPIHLGWLPPILNDRRARITSIIVSTTCKYKKNWEWVSL